MGKCPINSGAMQSYLALSYILTYVLGAGQQEHFIIETIDGAVYPFVFNPVNIKQNKTKKLPSPPTHQPSTTNKGYVSSCPNMIFRTLSMKGKTAILNKHNNLRRKVAKGKEANQPKAANMRKLSWSIELEELAQSWADNCETKHNPDARGVAGENWASLSTSDQWSKTAVEDNLVESVEDGWYAEVSLFSSQDIHPFRFDPATGHYTQVVWAETEAVGCGLAYYSKGGGYEGLLVCNYKDAGNIVNSRLYITGKACSACPDRYSCWDGLCGKMNFEWK